MTHAGVSPTDKLFADSPDAGHPDCLCSRCGLRIYDDEIPIRFFAENDLEYRFHHECYSMAWVEL